MATPINGLPELSASQNQKYLTVNQTFRRLDVLVNLTVFNRTVTAPPGGPSDGDRYIVAGTATGDFTGQENNVAMFLGSDWIFFTPSEGWRAYDQGADEFILFDGSDWVVNGVSTGSLSDGSINLLGVAATPDSTNRFSVTSPGVLFNRETDDLTITFNKDAAGDTLQALFQTGFSTRAQFGLLANDDFTFQVSPDGAVFHQAITIDKDTGNVAIGAGSDANNKLLVSGSSALFTSSGSFSFVFSKGAVGDDASITFQTNFSGRALIGLLGDDNFGFTVSDDGAAYTQAMIINAATAAISFEQHPKFLAYMNFSGDQYIGTATWTKIGFNNTVHNDQADFAGGSNQFTAPHDGVFAFGAGYRFRSDTTDPTAVQLGFSVNGAAPAAYATITMDMQSIVANTYVTGTTLLKLTAGQTVEVQAFFVGQDGYILDDENYFWGHQVA